MSIGNDQIPFMIRKKTWDIVFLILGIQKKYKNNLKEEGQKCRLLFIMYNDKVI